MIRLWRPIVAALLFAGVVLGVRVWHRWPDVAALATRDPSTSASIERERQVRDSAGIAWEWIPLDDVSPHLARAVLVAEDIDFHSHGGFAWGEIRLVAGQALRTGAPWRGASTISQQLAKNLWLSPERSLWRKLKEAALTLELERSLPKRRILELYLNLVAFGPGVFGAEAAAQRYFAKPALFLSELEGAKLAAGLSRPSVWNPGVDSDAYRDRVDLIRRRMAAAEFLWRHLLD